MATDLEKLVVTLEATTRNYERALARAQGTTVSAMRKIESTMNESMRRQETIMARAAQRIAGSFKGLGAGLVAGLGLEKIVDAVGSAVKAMDDLADSAEALGISAQELQTWNRMAQSVGASTDQMTRILNKLADQAHDSKSDLTELFAEFGKAPTGNATQDLQTFMDILQQMHEPGQRMAAIIKVLGERLGPNFAEMLAQGGQAFQQTFAQMEQDGEHFTNAQLEEAGKIQAEWDMITSKMQTSFQKFVITTIQGWGLIFGKLDEYWTKLRAVQADDRRGLLEILNSQGPPVPGANLGSRINRNPFDPGPVVVGGGQVVPNLIARGGTPGGTAMLNQNFAARLYGAIRAAEKATGAQARITSTGRTRAEQAELYARYLSGRGGLAAPPGRSRHEIGMAADIGAGPVLDWLHAHASEFNLEFLKGRAGEIDPGHIQMRGAGVEGPEQQQARQTETLKRNTAAVRENVEAKKTLSAQQIADMQLYDQTESNITMLSRAYETQQGQMEQQAQSMAAIGDTLASSVSGFVHDLMNGVDAGEAFSNMLKNLASQLVDMAIKQLFSGLFGGGMGGGGGLLGGLFSGGMGNAAAPAMVGMGTTGRMRGAGSSSAISIGGATINVAGNADTRTVGMMSKMIEVNNQQQTAKLNREWGQRTARYRNLRAP